MKFFFTGLLLLHGFIHFMGFAKAFQYGDLKQLSLPISKPIGMLWLATAFLFIVTAILFMLKKEYWWMVAMPAIIISQVVIITSWQDAKFGTIANSIILLVAIFYFTANRFEKTFYTDVKNQLQINNNLSADLLLEKDLKTLPFPVKNYLHYTGVVNKPKVKNMRIVFDGQLRSKGKNWMTFQSVQYNFIKDPSRLFFMKAKMFGITVPGYHHYINQKAVMDIRLFGLIPIIQHSGEEMNKAETVTLFNDMCLMAPATLIDKRIKWEAIDDTKAKAIFTNGNISISAILYFNEQGQLINFISGDRYDVNTKQFLPFSTPVHTYTNQHGCNVVQTADAVWHYDDGEFVYGKFTLREIEYNLE